MAHGIPVAEELRAVLDELADRARVGRL